MGMATRTATQWGVFDVTVRDGRIESVAPLGIDPDPSPIGQVLVDGIQHPLRIERPAVREGWLRGGPERARERRGAERFVEVPWDEALDLAAEELDRVVREHGNTSIYGGSYGWASAGRFHHAQSQLHRFLNGIGGCTRSVNSYSTAAAQVILPHVVAPWHVMELEQTTWNEIAEGARLVVSFGGLPLRNCQVSYGGITEHETRGGMQRAVDRGVCFVTIGPMGVDTPEFLNHRWIPCRPGTDVALMLGVAHVLETEGLVDRGFVDRCTVGYESFLAYLLGETDGTPKSPAWAEAITAVPAATIADLAREMAADRTLLNASWSLQRGHHGEQPYWMLVTLACMLGDVGLPGGGFGFGHADEGHIGSDGRRFAWPAHNKGGNPAGLAIPVARIADMLLNPGTTIDYDGERITFPDIRLIYWAGGNPFHHHQDLNRLVQAWQRPDTVIVHEPWWTPVARHADIVFPATTALEREDICASSHDQYAHAMRQVVEPAGRGPLRLRDPDRARTALGVRRILHRGARRAGMVAPSVGPVTRACPHRGLQPADLRRVLGVGHAPAARPRVAPRLVGRIPQGSQREPARHAIGQARDLVGAHRQLRLRRLPRPPRVARTVRAVGRYRQR